MPINISVPDLAELKPRITVFGVGGGGCNAVNNMINSNLTGVEFVVANTDAQALAKSPCERKIQMGVNITQGLGAGSQPEIGAAAAEETISDIIDHLAGSHMVFITAGMGGGTGTGAAPVIARAAREQGILTVGVVTKPFNFEGRRRMAIAERGIDNLAQHVDTLIVIPNQNLFRVANEATSFTAAFAMADQVLYSGVASITELMTKEGLINLDFADVRAVMSDMGKAMMGTGEASGDNRAEEAALAAISNPLLDIDSMAGARGVLISIAGGPDLTLYEVDQAASRIREEVDPEANIIVGATIEEDLEGTMRVSVVATGLMEEGKAAETEGASTQARQGAALPPGLGTGMGGAGLMGMSQAGQEEEARTEDAAARDVAEEKVTAGEAQEEREQELPLDAPPARGTQEQGAEREIPAAPEMKTGDTGAGGMATAADGIDTDINTPLHEPAPIAPMAPEIPEPVVPRGAPAPQAGKEANAMQGGGQERPVAAGNVPGMEELPPQLQSIVQQKQQRLEEAQRRSGLISKVKDLLGRGHRAPGQPEAAPHAGQGAGTPSTAGRTTGGAQQAGAATPQNVQPLPPRQQPQPPQHAAAESPVEDDDALSIPAFLRRR